MKKFVSIVLALCLVLCLFAGCAGQENGKDDEPEVKEEQTTIRVGALTGPTSMGLVKLMDESRSNESENTYEFTLQSEASAFVSAIAKGELDIAAVPANHASVIYNNTDGAVKLLAVNTLGVLYIVERGESVNSLADLSGKTVYATGEGAAPEYGLRYLLKENGLDGDNAPTIRWCADTTEALSYIANDPNAIAMLPQPFVTAAQAQVEGLRVAIDLNAEWEKLDNGSQMVTGVVVVRSEFADKYPQQLNTFMKEYGESVEFVNSNNEEAAELIGSFEIVKAPIALKALPFCHITFLTGDEMKEAMEGYLGVLFEMNAKAIGGAMPADDFYYSYEADK